LIPVLVEDAMPTPSLRRVLKWWLLSLRQACAQKTARLVAEAAAFERGEPAPAAGPLAGVTPVTLIS